MLKTKLRYSISDLFSDLFERFRLIFLRLFGHNLARKANPKMAKDKFIKPPPLRRLQTFAFDPDLSTRLETVSINRIVQMIPWEDLEPGPVGEYVEVVDVDPASDAVYPPIDLDQAYLIAQDGLSPSEGNPQFHQQMAYATAMSTILHFERALGRPILWASRQHGKGSGDSSDGYIHRLRIYPHALREANAYYSPNKVALLFGYFPATPADRSFGPSAGTVFTSLSHDIIVHETTHAILDGLHPRFAEPSNVDVLAFHEAFADIVAIFQHFTHPEVLRDQIARTRGELANQNLLAQLAQQFGQATGGRGALRDALGDYDRETGEWTPKKPDPTALDRTREPHARGALLVAAVFDAFLRIYKFRIADLLRIATAGTGVLPVGSIHPDLVNRLAAEASKSASHVLRICIRALDYCPPVDVTFGDYLRALITADVDMFPNDARSYRLAFIEAFRKYGIYPLDVRSLSEESLLWLPPVLTEEQAEIFSDAFSKRIAWSQLTRTSDREGIFQNSRKNRGRFHGVITSTDLRKCLPALGLTMASDARASIYRKNNLPALEVHSIRPAYRYSETEGPMTDIVIELTQRRMGYLSEDSQKSADTGNTVGNADFTFRGGCTMLVDMESGQIRYAIYKHVDSQRRLERQRRFLSRPYGLNLQATYFGDIHRLYYENMGANIQPELFALVHRANPEGDESL